MEKEKKLTEYRTWRSRRRLAIASFLWMVIVTILIFFVVPESRLTVLKDPITWQYFINGGIITAYMGFKAFGKEEMRIAG
jgi:uncharacterized membrane protein